GRHLSRHHPLIWSDESCMLFSLGRATAGPAALHVARKVDRVVFVCNICGKPSEQALAALTREGSSCKTCGSSVRMRAVLHVLAMELFGEPVVVPDFPRRPDLRGLGLSDWDRYAEPLSRVCAYTNTFYHQEPRLDVMAIDPALE